MYIYIHIYVCVCVCVRIIEGDFFCHAKSISKHLAERHEDFFVHVIFVTVDHGVDCFAVYYGVYDRLEARTD
jgi:hypothetical protein